MPPHLKSTQPDVQVGWPPAARCLPLSPTDIHVWAAGLDQPPENVAALRSILSPDETIRAARFHFERDRHRFAVARGALRSLLGCYLSLSPAQVQINYSPRGKPAVSSPLHFNLSHSGELALLAVTRIGEIGVDVEHIRPVKDAGHIAERFFSPRESAAFKSLPRLKKPAAFFNLWTRKESWLKATGEGLSDSLSQVEVSFLPNETPRFLHLPQGAGAPQEWLLHNLAPAPGYAGAVAIRAQAAAVHTWRWHPTNLLAADVSPL